MVCAHTGLESPSLSSTFCVLLSPTAHPRKSGQALPAAMTFQGTGQPVLPCEQGLQESQERSRSKQQNYCSNSKLSLSHLFALTSQASPSPSRTAEVGLARSPLNTFIFWDARLMHLIRLLVLYITSRDEDPCLLISSSFFITFFNQIKFQIKFPSIQKQTGKLLLCFVSQLPYQLFSWMRWLISCKQWIDQNLLPSALLLLLEISANSLPN